jgi:Uma2 family endonuclease
MDTAQRRATYEDLLLLPEGVRAEVIGGEVIFLPNPLPVHQFIASALSGFLAVPLQHRPGARERGEWWIIPDCDVRLEPHEIVQPDVAGWRRTRLPDPWHTRPIDVVPDWACEILSPSNARHDLVTKRGLYARFGVRHYWLIDPATRTLTALELRGELWVELGAWDDMATARIAPFDAIELEVGALFPPAPEVVHER